MNSPSDTFPVITTERCYLRNIIETDQQKIFEGLSNPEVIKYYGVSYATPEATKTQMDFYNNLLFDETGIWWAVCLKKHNDLIGACGFNNLVREHQKAEIGFWALPSFQQMGYMSEAVAAILAFGFDELHLHRIEAVVESGNEKSSKLLTKLGFKCEGIHKESEWKNGKFIDLVYYALLSKR